MSDSICLSCGLCCSGALFRFVGLAPSDNTAALEAAGVRLTTKDDRPALPLPCAAHDGSCCTVYEDRPARCGAFTCALYRRHEAGEVPTDVALTEIASTVELYGIVRSRLQHFLHAVDAPIRTDPSLADLVEGLKAVIESAPDPEAVKEALSLTLLYTAALDQRISRYFRDDPTS